MQQPASSSMPVVLASDVGTKVASATLTRQNNTTPYLAGDVWAFTCGAATANLWGVLVVGDG
jgi:hypothetical protein